MTRTSKYTTWGLLATLAAATASPVLANQQSDKNNMRNLAIAGAAIAGYGLLNHNNAATLLGTAGAALAGSQYEQDRRQQSQDSNDGYYNDGYYGRRYHRPDNNGQWRSNGDNNGQWRGNYNSSYDHGDQNANPRRDNGRKLGWTQHRDQDDTDRR